LQALGEKVLGAADPKTLTGDKGNSIRRIYESINPYKLIPSG
jgi:hypothetical protein